MRFDLMLSTNKVKIPNGSQFLKIFTLHTKSQYAKYCNEEYEYFCHLILS